MLPQSLFFVFRFTSEWPQCERRIAEIFVPPKGSFGPFVSFDTTFGAQGLSSTTTLYYV
jgi:hypothetical protein